MLFQRSINTSSLRQKKFVRFLLLFVIVSIIVFTIAQVLSSAPEQQLPSVASSETQLKGAKLSAPIARVFTFPLTKDKDGKSTIEFTFYLDRVDTHDQIVLKGQRATAVEGRDYLLVLIKITNSHNQTFKINTKDYVRLSIDGGTEWLAPQVHNDPVEVQAISTQSTRLGWFVNEGQREFLLQVGEIDGPKESISLNLK